jgi:hypothetical protein
VGMPGDESRQYDEWRRHPARLTQELTLLEGSAKHDQPRFTRVAPDDFFRIS